MKTYSEKLKDPRWQRKRLEIMQRDNFKCSQCHNGDITLNVHHWQYSKEPWDAKNEDLTTVCHLCHKEIEHCKDLTKELLKHPNFRFLLSNIERLIRTDKDIKVAEFHSCVTVFIENDDKEYHYLEYYDSYKVGDEIWDDQTKSWEVITRVADDDFCLGAKIRRRIDELSDFDRLIESAPDNY
jgi:hypothetical protein